MENEIMVNNILSGFKAASSVNEKTFSAADKTKAEEAAESFEAFFLSRMMESMFEASRPRACSAAVRQKKCTVRYYWMNMAKKWPKSVLSALRIT